MIDDSEYKCTDINCKNYRNRKDFSKLKKGDLLIIEDHKKKSVGFFYRISSNCIFLSMGDNQRSRGYIDLKIIKKITLINIEKNTFEEI